MDSAKSRVLRTAELLELVVSAMIEDTVFNPYGQLWGPPSQNLVWAALTCKSFYDPAMNVLWRTIESWEPIVNLIDVVKKLENDNIYMTTGLISERHLERMDSYVRRIRHFALHIPGHNSVKVSPYIFERLSEIRPLGVFPALRDLTIWNFDEYDLSDIPNLWLTLSPTLSEIKLDGTGADGVTEALVEKISQSSPGIQKIRIQEGAGFELASLSGVVERFSNLNELFLDISDVDVSANDIDSFSRLRKLQNLGLYMGEDAQFISAEPKDHNRLIREYDHAAFDSLETLFVAAQPKTVLNILEQMPALNSITKVSIHIIQKDDDIAPYVLQKILRLCSSTLRDLQMKYDDGIPAMSHNDFRSLAEHSLPRLEILNIRLDRVDKELFTAISKASLPHTLTTLRLSLGANSSPAGYQLLASELGLIAEILPNLQTLHIPLFMDMSEGRLKEMRRFVRPSGGRPPVKQNIHPLRQLLVDPLRWSLATENTEREPRMIPASQRNVGTAYAYARYLHHVFPCLRNPSIQCSFDNRGDQRWQEIVCSLMKGFFEEESSEDESHAKD